MRLARVFEGVTVEFLKNDDPLQFAAIGLVGVDFVTVIFEERRDEEGIYLVARHVLEIDRQGKRDL